MRIALAVALSALAFAAAAQSTARPLPAGTLPLDVPPPITAVPDIDEPADAARTNNNGQVIEEPRARGKVIQRITPRHGRSYVMMDPKSDGSLTKLDNSIDGHLSVPQWVLMEF